MSDQSNNKLRSFRNLAEAMSALKDVERAKRRAISEARWPEEKVGQPTFSVVTNDRPRTSDRRRKLMTT